MYASSIQHLTVPPRSHSQTSLTIYLYNMGGGGLEICCALELNLKGKIWNNLTPNSTNDSNAWSFYFGKPHIVDGLDIQLGFQIWVFFLRLSKLTLLCQKHRLQQSLTHYVAICAWVDKITLLFFAQNISVSARCRPVVCVLVYNFLIKKRADMCASLTYLLIV